MLLLLVNKGTFFLFLSNVGSIVEAVWRSGDFRSAVAKKVEDVLVQARKARSARQAINLETTSTPSDQTAQEIEKYSIAFIYRMNLN